MGRKTHILDGDPPIEVALKRNPRARRFTLRVSRSGGTVSLSMPPFAREAEALSFLHDRAGWVRKHLSDAPGPRRPEIGGGFPVQGVERLVQAAHGRAARFRDGVLFMPEGPRGPVALTSLLKRMAREELAARCAVHARALGRSHGKITLRDTRSRWGSCSSRGDLMFCWRLIMAPTEVLDYVAAHEVAHLAHMDHSPAFWATCARLCPGYAAPRGWLKAQGSELLAWRFDSLP